jgi:hypothetical protein
MNGFVKQVMVRNGEYAAAGQPVLVVSQNRELLIKAEIQPAYFNALATISGVTIKVLNSNLTYNLEDLNGKWFRMANPLICKIHSFRLSCRCRTVPACCPEVLSNCISGCEQMITHSQFPGSQY